MTAPAAVSLPVRARACPLCQALPGEPCSPKPEGDHLARHLDAFTAGRLSRAYLAMVLGELVVIDVKSTMIRSRNLPAGRGGIR